MVFADKKRDEISTFFPPTIKHAKIIKYSSSFPLPSLSLSLSPSYSSWWGWWWLVGAIVEMNFYPICSKRKRFLVGKYLTNFDEDRKKFIILISQAYHSKWNCFRLTFNNITHKICFKRQCVRASRLRTRTTNALRVNGGGSKAMKNHSIGVWIQGFNQGSFWGHTIAEAVSRSMTMWRPTFAITFLLAKTHVCIAILPHTQRCLIKETGRILAVCWLEIQYQHQQQQQNHSHRRTKNSIPFVLISNDLNAKVSIRPNPPNNQIGCFRFVDSLKKISLLLLHRQHSNGWNGKQKPLANNKWNKNA